MSFIKDSKRTRAGQEIIDIQNSVQSSIATLKSLKNALISVKQYITDDQNTFNQDDVIEITNIYTGITYDISNI